VPVRLALALLAGLLAACSRSKPVPLTNTAPDASQAQAEAITFLQDGNGYLLGTEFTSQPLWRTGCR
jgi:hypothetical protein